MTDEHKNEKIFAPIFTEEQITDFALKYAEKTIEKMKKELTCITCPMGCQLTVVDKNDDGNFEVTGNTCKRGPKYAINELTNPTRVIPTTVVVRNGMLPRLPVKTAEPIPKGQIFEAMKAINQVVVDAPVKIGDVVIENLLGLGINVVSTKNMDRC